MSEHANTETKSAVKEGVPASIEAAARDEPVPFSQFLETVHPCVRKPVSDLSGTEKTTYRIASVVQTPDLRLHCKICDGERTFRSISKYDAKRAGTQSVFLDYKCGDCQRQLKKFCLLLYCDATSDGGFAYKYGEEPPFGVHVSNRVLRLFGKDAELFNKGRRCESQGLGIGAFAYYRRVVESHRNDIFDEIIRVCKTVAAPSTLVEELQSAKGEISFVQSVEKIKTALPQGLLINGRNPLTALHRALSVGMHNESDEACLQMAHDVRIVLIDLAEKMASLRQENKELSAAIESLISINVKS